MQNFVIFILPEFNDVYSRKLRWAGHAARMRESVGAYRILVGKPKGRRPLERPRHRWKDNINIILFVFIFYPKNHYRMISDTSKRKIYKKQKERKKDST
jgi:hypothetical protein